MLPLSIGFIGSVISGAGDVVGVKKDSASHPSASPNQPATPSTPQYRAVDINTLITDYDNNQLAANDKYAGRLIKITGIIDNVSIDILGNPYITIKPSNDQYYMGTTIQCFTTETEAKKVTNDAQATLGGKTDEMSMGIIVLKDCVVQ